MNVQVIVYVIIAIVIILIVIAFFNRKKADEYKMITLIINTFVGLSALVTVFNPQGVATVIYPDVSTYIQENKDLIENNEEISNQISDMETTNQKLFEENEKLKKDNDILSNSILNLTDLNNELSNKDFADVHNSKLFEDGLEICNLNNSVAIVDSEVYYNETVLSKLLDKNIKYDSEKQFIIIGNENIKSISKFKFSDVINILYDGVQYQKYSPKDNDVFKVAGLEYNDGFLIGYNNTTFGKGDGYALFNLQGKFSEVNFDVGKIDEEKILDVTMKIYIDDELYEKYDLSSEIPYTHISIDLNGANNMKILLTRDENYWGSVYYGFFNVIFSE